MCMDAALESVGSFKKVEICILSEIDSSNFFYGTILNLGFWNSYLFIYLLIIALLIKTKFI